MFSLKRATGTLAPLLYFAYINCMWPDEGQYGINVEDHRFLQPLVILAFLFICGDIELNPKPIYNTCVVFVIKCNQKGIQCDRCEVWHHTHCIGMSDTAYRYLGWHKDMWFCFHCSLPQFSDSYFDAEDHCLPHLIRNICSQLSVTDSSSVTTQI